MADVFRFDPSALRSRRRSRAELPADHFVEFYENDDDILFSATTFIATGIAQDEAAIVIAEPRHIEAMEARLGRSIDLLGARRERRYASFGALDCLVRFMDGNVPDPDKFDRMLRDVMRRVDNRKPLRVFGEMVSILWAEGKIFSALALEDLWNQAVTKYCFRLFCAYATGAMAANALADIEAVCSRHTHVLGPRYQA